MSAQPGVPEEFVVPERVRATRRLFDSSIEDDPWIVFHGTAGHNERSIEEHGFSDRFRQLYLNEIRQLVAVFDAMDWGGLQFDSLAILKPFSLQHDFAGTQGSAIFFSTTSLWAICYATRRMSGGEKYHAVRCALDDLDAYLVDAEVREEHHSHMQAKFAYLTQGNADRDTLERNRPRHVDLEWLAGQVAGLQELRRMVFAATSMHTHGVVYAVRIEPADAEHLLWNHHMGIELRGEIPSGRIVRKARIDASFELGVPYRTGEDALCVKQGGIVDLLARCGRVV